MVASEGKIWDYQKLRNIDHRHGQPFYMSGDKKAIYFTLRNDNDQSKIADLRDNKLPACQVEQAPWF